MAPQAKLPPSCIFVVFGAAGDLTSRLLLPALYNLRRAKLLPEKFAVLGVARRDENDESFRCAMGAALREFAHAGATDADVEWLEARTHYLRGAFDDPELYSSLARRLAELGKTGEIGGNALFYLATPPTAFAPIAQRLGAAGLLREAEGGWRRMIIEKPFGHDLSSAEELNRALLAVAGEDQIFRIDHYLGKETVQNIMVLRFANGLFEPLWNREHIDHIQITVAETVGVGSRGKFYDATGALRDMAPNHLFQLLTLTAMEPPSCFSPESLRSEKTKVLDAVHSITHEQARTDVVRAQYGVGVIDGKIIRPYRKEDNVAPNSVTETFVAMKLMVDNWRWAGVPFYVRTGKALVRKRSEIVIQFKQAPLAIFRDTPIHRLTPNDLILHIQPEEGASLRFGAKVPGPVLRVGGVEMKFNYQDYFNVALSTGYETLLYDCMMGDASLFQRADSIEEGWRVVQPLLEAWAEDDAKELPLYPAGSAGPYEAEALLTRDGRRWRGLGEVTEG